MVYEEDWQILAPKRLLYSDLVEVWLLHSFIETDLHHRADFSFILLVTSYVLGDKQKLEICEQDFLFLKKIIIDQSNWAGKGSLFDQESDTERYLTLSLPAVFPDLNHLLIRRAFDGSD